MKTKDWPCIFELFVFLGFGFTLIIFGSDWIVRSLASMIFLLSIIGLSFELIGFYPIEGE
jgi:hypothetical protein